MINGLCNRFCAPLAYVVDSPDMDSRSALLSVTVTGPLRASVAVSCEREGLARSLETMVSVD